MTLDFKKGTKMLKLEADMCGACKMMEPVWKQVREENSSKDIEFMNINLDEYPDMAETFEIKSIPTFIVLKNGREQERKIGTCKKEYLNKMVEHAIV